MGSQQREGAAAHARIHIELTDSELSGFAAASRSLTPDAAFTRFTPEETFRQCLSVEVGLAHMGVKAW